MDGPTQAERGHSCPPIRWTRFRAGSSVRRSQIIKGLPSRRRGLGGSGFRRISGSGAGKDQNHLNGVF
jgi:hypothetical protein